MNEKITQINNGDSVIISTTAFLQTTHDLAESNAKVKQLQDLLDKTEGELARLKRENENLSWNLEQSGWLKEQP